MFAHLLTCCQCSRIRILRFFQISKKHYFFRFFLNDVSESRKNAGSPGQCAAGGSRGNPAG